MPEQAWNKPESGMSCRMNQRLALGVKFSGYLQSRHHSNRIATYSLETGYRAVNTINVRSLATFRLLSSLFVLSLVAAPAWSAEVGSAKDSGTAQLGTVPLTKSISENKIALTPPGTITSVNASDNYRTKDEGAVPSILSTSPVMVSTTDSIPGYNVIAYKGLARGDVVIEPTIMQSLKASLKGIIGGKLDPYTRMCNRARLEAYDGMIQQAQQLGANAIIGMSYDASTFSVDENNVGTEVFCIGTAVTVIPDSNRVSSVPSKDSMLK
jgi:uncharacterized protein YbjQ (UPF0145 family)